KDEKDRFPRAMDVCRQIVDQIPSSIVVISCLNDFYEQGRKFLTRSILDRIEVGPEPTRLTAHRSLDEIEALISLRLRFLYESLGVRFHDEEPLFPFRRSDLEPLTNLRTRDVLEWCRAHRERCIS